MIITSRHCLFPSLCFNALNLNPDAYYSFRLEFEMLAPNRFRFSNGTWKVVGSPKNIDDSSAAIAAASSNHKGEMYTHPDRVKLSSHWMANPISFAKAKLANKVRSQSTVAKKALKLNAISTSSSKRKVDSTSATNSNHSPEGPHSKPLGDSYNYANVFHMESFHKYRPRVVLTELAKDSNEILSTTAYTFDLANYMAVTRYENENVNDLKKSFNSHARAFRGTIGKIPARGFHRPQELQKHSSPANRNSRLNKRARSISRPEGTGGDSEDVTDINYLHEEEVDIDADVNDLEATGSVDVAMTGIFKNDARPTSRLDKENSALVTISLGKDAKQVAKVSKRTTQQHYAQHRQVSQHGGEIDILRLPHILPPKASFRWVSSSSQCRTLPAAASHNWRISMEQINSRSIDSKSHSTILSGLQVVAAVVSTITGGRVAEECISQPFFRESVVSFQYGFQPSLGRELSHIHLMAP